MSNVKLRGRRAHGGRHGTDPPGDETDHERTGPSWLTDHRDQPFLGGGKQDDDYYILEDDERQAELTTPGLLQDRLLVLPAKALEAIQALPAQCREDPDYMGWLKPEYGDWTPSNTSYECGWLFKGAFNSLDQSISGLTCRSHMSFWQQI